MRERLEQAELVLALINDNDDADVALGGGHWCARFPPPSLPPFISPPLHACGNGLKKRSWRL
jgi:hypothetical protein